MECYRCIHMYPGDTKLSFLDASEAGNENNLKRVILMTLSIHNGGCIINGVVPTDDYYYVVWIRSAHGDKIKTPSTVPSAPQARRVIREYQNFGWCKKGTSQYIDTVIMKFTDETFTQPMSMEQDDPLVKSYIHKPQIKEWLDSYRDDLKPI